MFVCERVCKWLLLRAVVWRRHEGARAAATASASELDRLSSAASIYIGPFVKKISCHVKGSKVKNPKTFFGDFKPTMNCFYFRCKFFTWEVLY